MTTTARDSKDAVRSGDLWMRRVSFAGLHRVLHVLAEHPGGLTPGELDELVIQRGIYPTARGTPPKRATRYHCRNTLIKLGAIRRTSRRLFVNTDRLETQGLLAEPTPQGARLSVHSQRLFASLVAGNRECRLYFLDYFMPGRPNYTAEEFREKARSVVWRSSADHKGKPHVLQTTDGSEITTLESPVEVKSILYGVRYWARDELDLIDEVFREAHGVIMYPVRSADARESRQDLAREILRLIDGSHEWTQLSVHDLAAEFCERGRRPLHDLFSAIALVARDHPDEIILTPTSAAFASLSAGHRMSVDVHRRSYFRDTQGRYISHLRLHRSLRGVA